MSGVYPAPRPKARPKKPRKELRSRTPIAKKNSARKKKRFETDFGGAEYLAFIRGLPCDICGVVGFSEAAHLKSRGAGGKASDVAALCGKRMMPTGRCVLTMGCHFTYDCQPWLLPEGTKERLKKLASERRKNWLAAHSLLDTRPVVPANGDTRE